MKQIYTAYRLFSTLSLDVAIGVAAIAMLWAKTMDVLVQPIYIVALSISTWIIYTADHLYDGFKVKDSALTLRHQFHYQHRKILIFVLIGLGLLLIGMISHMQIEVILFGLMLLVLILLSFFFLKYVSWLKETLIAVGFTIGVAISFVNIELLRENEFKFSFVQLALTALINLIAFSFYDYNRDQKMGFHSFATIFGTKKTINFIGGLLTIQLLTFYFLVSIFSIWLFCLSLVFTLMVYFEPNCLKNENHRLLGDGLWMTGFLFV
ncbi:MAG: UbiA family prenyltransferase [Chryseotalea sp.]|jgi:4-hydroxybenzoate polyprenyltransferase